MAPSLIGSLIISLLLAQAQLERMIGSTAYAENIPVMMVMRDPSLVVLASTTAAKYGINREHFVRVIECESGFDPKVRGDEGLARGIAQIRSDYHAEVSDAEADDPAWALDWMAKRWSAGYAHEWTCWRIYYGAYTQG